jgi:RNA polymerase sigma factor (sigma-70 family)
MRLAKMFPKSLDDSLPEFSTESSSGEPAITRVVDRKADVVRNVRRTESKEVIEEVFLVLSPRERLVIERIKDGNSLREIAEKMGITKQAVHQISQPAMGKLRNRLAQLGYHSLDSSGFLRSFQEKQTPSSQWPRQ